MFGAWVTTSCCRHTTYKSAWRMSISPWRMSRKRHLGQWRQRIHRRGGGRSRLRRLRGEPANNGLGFAHINGSRLRRLRGVPERGEHRSPVRCGMIDRWAESVSPGFRPILSRPSANRHFATNAIAVLGPYYLPHYESAPLCSLFSMAGIAAGRGEE